MQINLFLCKVIIQKHEFMEMKKTRKEVMKKFMASKNRKREHLLKLEKEMRKEYKERTGMEAKHFVVL